MLTMRQVRRKPLSVFPLRPSPTTIYSVILPLSPLYIPPPTDEPNVSLATTPDARMTTPSPPSLPYRRCNQSKNRKQQLIIIIVDRSHYRNKNAPRSSVVRYSICKSVSSACYILYSCIYRHWTFPHASTPSPCIVIHFC